MELSLEAQVRCEVARYALDERIAAAKGMSGTAHYALQATTEVSAEEARAKVRTLHKNLEKQVQRRQRQWS